MSVHELPNSEFFVVKSPSYIRLFATPWTAARQAPLSSTLFQSLLKLTFIKSVMLSNHAWAMTLLSSCLHLSQHQCLFQRVSSSCQVAQSIRTSTSAFQSFQWIFRADFHQDWLVWSPCSSSFLGGCLVSQLCLTLFATPWTAAHQASLSFTISQSLLILMSILPSQNLAY